MAFSDPITITVNAIAKVLNRTGSGMDISRYTSDDGLNEVVIRHSTNRKTGVKSHNVNFKMAKIAADPFTSGLNQKYQWGYSLTITAPPTGVSTTELKQGSDGFTAWLNASSGAALLKLIAGES